MASPLLAYANSRVLIDGQDIPTIVDGRIVTTCDCKYLVKCFMKRMQSTNTTSGSIPVPVPTSRGGEMLPGVRGDKFYYRGYALQYVEIGVNDDWLTAPDSAFTWINITQQYAWMLPGREIRMKFGNDPILESKIERSSGRYGGMGIDEIVYNEIGGIEFQVTGGEVQN